MDILVLGLIMGSMNRWLVKTEPSAYSFEDLRKEGRTVWEGVKNPLALKNLSQIAKGDLVLVYHTGSQRAIVGQAKAASKPYPDPKRKNPKLLVVDLEAGAALKRPVTLAELKTDAQFKSFDLVRLGRLSVLPVPDLIWNALRNLAATALALLLLCLRPSYALALDIKPSDPRIQLLGRASLTLPDQVRFDWPGTGFAFRFEGSGLTLKLSGEGQRYNLYLDGKQAQALKAQPGQTAFEVAAQGSGPHSLKLSRRMDGNSGLSVFSGLLLREGTRLVDPESRPVRRVEFLGDSFTAGYGVEGLDLACEDKAAFHNADLAFGSLLGKTLRAEVRLTAISGRGLVRNYGDKKTASENPFGPSAFHSCQNLDEDTGPASWIPDAVVVCLGANDYSTQPWPEEGRFLQAYRSLVQEIRRRYPKAGLILTTDSGAAPALDAVKLLVEEFKAGGPVETLSLPALDKSLLGCDWHPNIKGQELIALAFEPSLRKLLGL